ncbi:MAG TPA: hypothetical protein VF472_19105 [Burkholderiaceae bacterium]
MKGLPWLGVIGLCLGLGGCAVVPPQSAQLSASVGQQLQDIRQSHLAYIDRTYAILEAEANRAVDNIYGPKLITAALNGSSGATLMSKLEAGKRGGEDAKTAVLYTTRFLENIRKNVEAERARVLQPIRDQRTLALANANQAWNQVMQGNTTLTIYLDSLSKLRDAQDELLAKAGLVDLQDKTAATLTDISDRLNELLIQANDKDADINRLESDLRDIVGKAKNQ